MKNNKQKRIIKKQLLLLKINYQRFELLDASKEWLDATQRYDSIWRTVVTLRPLLYAICSIFTAFKISRHSSKFSMVIQRSIPIWQLVKSVQRINKKRN